MTKQEAYQLALQAGFMLSTEYGQETNKLMPATDGETLMELIRLVEAKVKGDK
jgi:hypothetical protein